MKSLTLSLAFLVGSAAMAHAFPITSGVLNSVASEGTASGGSILPGDILEGVTFSMAVGSGSLFNRGAGGGFVGGWLDRAANTGERALNIGFYALQSGFGFVTSKLMAAFDVTIS